VLQSPAPAFKDEGSNLLIFDAGAGFEPTSPTGDEARTLWILDAGGRIRTCELCPSKTRALSLILTIAKNLAIQKPSSNKGPAANFIDVLASIHPRGDA